MMKWHEGWIGGEHNETEIKGFFDDYRWLSNFEPCEVHYEGLIFKSSEAAYQAAKTLDLEQRQKFTEMGAGESKKAGRKLEIREDWEMVKNNVMFSILLDKFTRNPELGQKLLDTGDKYIEETNWWGDTYWGVCRGKGANVLGQLLTAVREELKMGVI